MNKSRIVATCLSLSVVLSGASPNQDVFCYSQEKYFNTPGAAYGIAADGGVAVYANAVYNFYCPDGFVSNCGVCLMVQLIGPGGVAYATKQVSPPEPCGHVITGNLPASAYTQIGLLPGQFFIINFYIGPYQDNCSQEPDDYESQASYYDSIPS